MEVRVVGILLQEAVDGEDPEGLFSLGVFKIDTGDVEGGWEMIDTAAAAGFEKAITFTVENPRENQS